MSSLWSIWLNLLSFFFYIYLFILRERGREQGGAERDGGRIPRRLSAVNAEPDAVLELTNHEILARATKSWALARLSHPGTPKLNLLFLKKIFNVYFFFKRKRLTEYEQGKGRERKEDTESETESRFWAVSTEPDVGLKPTNCEIMTWAEVGRSTDWATESETDSRFWAVSSEPDVGLKPTNREIMTWAEVGRSTDWATQAPQNQIFFKPQVYLARMTSFFSPFLVLNCAAIPLVIVPTPWNQLPGAPHEKEWGMSLFDTSWALGRADTQGEERSVPVLHSPSLLEQPHHHLRQTHITETENVKPSHFSLPLWMLKTQSWKNLWAPHTFSDICLCSWLSEIIWRPVEGIWAVPADAVGLCNI